MNNENWEGISLNKKTKAKGIFYWKNKKPKLRICVT